MGGGPFFPNREELFVRETSQAQHKISIFPAKSPPVAMFEQAGALQYRDAPLPPSGGDWKGAFFLRDQLPKCHSQKPSAAIGV